MTDPDIKPEWRTADVVGLCLSMRESQDFSALPILADALQDAGCDDEDLLTILRLGSRSYFEDARLVAVVLDPDARAAAEWLEKLAAQLGPSYGYDGYDQSAVAQPMDYGVLMAAAKAHLDRDDYVTQWGSESWQDVMYCKYAEFWLHYRTVTGAGPADPESPFFSCSC